jgi:release factor glutamine methyltransferase
MNPVAATPAPARATAFTVADARRTWAAEFRVAGLDSPELDARLLVGYGLGLDHAAVAAAAARILDPAEQSAIAALAYRRLGHEPVARIVGVKEFWSLDLRINAATLVPRPETETVVEAALAAIDARDGRALGGRTLGGRTYGGRTRALRIADLGTGSGAILLALLTELPNAFGVGSDVSLEALALAHANARGLGLNRAAFVACNMAAALRGPFDLIVSNPPYIASDGIAGLPAEVRLFDPRLALDGGPDGLEGYRAIAATAPALLAPDGAVIVELGAGQAEAVAGLLAGAGLAPGPPRPDLSGVPRALAARKEA